MQYKNINDFKEVNIKDIITRKGKPPGSTSTQDTPPSNHAMFAQRIHEKTKPLIYLIFIPCE
jgi:hypothetical protein